jgi:hypothetical protein
MFNKYFLDLPTNIFKELSESISFENINKGRKATNIIECTDDGLIPLVRTTTIYKNPSQKFSPVHYQIIEKIKKISEYNEINFNSALVEIYNSNYRDMGYHSDQCLDLDKESYICIYSCYDDPETKDLSKLKIKNKITNDCFDITLDHNSIVIFSIDTNQKHLHKIVLEQYTKNNLWLGVTFRQSKTFLITDNNLSCYRIKSTNNILTLANENQRKDFYKCRSLEKSNIEYTYPEIDYTISPGDLIIDHMV